jgi:hypothetical protein
LLSLNTRWHLELPGKLPGISGAIFTLALMNSLNNDDVILGLQSEVFRSKSGQFQLDLELVVAGGHLDVVGSLQLVPSDHHTSSPGRELCQPFLQARAKALPHLLEEGILEEGIPPGQL